ncbi:MAG: hypothetical protein DRJ42_29435 [Deltaproteobacteria bacterium]|nr:MAG: hypothetical protein DRJ42_29435 [Deltaproteobacteria bacterium]
MGTGEDTMNDEETPREGSEFPPEDEDGKRRRRLEGMLGGAIRKGLEKGIEASIGTFTKTDNVFRELVGENVKLPKEIVSYIFTQVDETKNGMVRVVAGEVRDFLQATDIATEMQKALTSLSFEIKTEIRFIPNDSGGVKPEVKAEISPKKSDKAKKRRGRKSSPPEAGDPADADADHFDES